jgi:NADPH:quinone reductase-like Zn-dependent oxidoreductase
MLPRYVQTIGAADPELLRTCVGFHHRHAAFLLPFALFTYYRLAVQRRVRARVGRLLTWLLAGAAVLVGLVAVVIADRLTGTVYWAAVAFGVAAVLIRILFYDDDPN